MSEDSSPIIRETWFPVRYAETDAMGVVHHATYPVYFEEGRSQYMRDVGSDYADIEASGYRLPVTELGARYVSSAYYGQRVKIRSWISENRSRRVTFNYEVCNEEGTVLVTGFTRHIWTDDKGKVTRTPKDWVSVI